MGQCLPIQDQNHDQHWLPLDTRQLPGDLISQGLNVYILVLLIVTLPFKYLKTQIQLLSFSFHNTSTSEKP